ncbi:FAD-dependent oxidoreductase [Lentilactobacillus otakiensis]|uniref:NADH peroxidase n=1 Tax=Lentilactobacillus otakiensis DSM 19908 = JCM 15040 TaxID=1423780 RepID=S4NHF1_9LACO|nr:FAD-dependent oxidoreductase [Lentilactobacillus otakiensis]KRL09809.1 NADH peroxidase [Lentilactobacillus otakiensis DSM 19908 = JCM 15040]MDV3517160.1 FAD-dependent oxidoreductase [Lentilactobacillus otakiensis]GAD16602.1 NADH peroxidase [Lentilactobacillus otakiensis DSM 19908 = JCM 15040]
MKVIVVGSSHGGYEAVRGILAEQPDTEIQWYEKGDFISFLSCGMQLYLEGVVKNVNSVRYATAKGMRAKGVNVFVHQEVTSVNPDAHTVTVHNLDDDSTREEKYDKLILSAGAIPASIPVSGRDLENVYAMRGRDWAIRLKAKTVDPDVQNVTVIGAGYIGIEAAEVFSKAGKHVTLIDILPRPLALYLDQEFTDILEKTLTDHNIYLATGQTVKEFTGKDGKVTTVKTDQAEYPSDLVVETAGIKPNTNWLKDTLDLTDKGLVKVDDHLQTSQPDIYAVGDSTKVPFAPTGKSLQIALATNARRQGRIAAKNVLGHDMKMPAVSGSSALSVFDYHFASTGLKEGTSAANGVKTQSAFVTDTTQPPFVPDAAGNQQVYFKLTFNPENHQVLGAQIMSKRDVTANINAISLAIQGKMTLDDLAYADFFFQPGFDRPWNIMNVAAQEALQKLAQ